MENDMPRRIEEVLNTEHYISSVSPRPFFYTRVRAKMERKPALGIQMIPLPIRVACSAILVVNVAFFLSTFLITKSDNSDDQLASFYQLNTNAVYSNR